MTYGKWWRVEGLAFRGTTFWMLKVLKFFKLNITFKTEVSLNLLPINIQKAYKIAIKCFNHQRYQRPQNKTKQFIQKFFSLLNHLQFKLKFSFCCIDLSCHCHYIRIQMRERYSTLSEEHQWKKNSNLPDGLVHEIEVFFSILKYLSFGFFLQCPVPNF